MRGQRNLFDQYLPTPNEVPKGSTSGRNPILISARNERLLYRYYYYTQLLKFNYPDTIATLVQQFDLSELRITVCIQLNYSRLKEIITVEKPSRKFLKATYPWLNWDDQS